MTYKHAQREGCDSSFIWGTMRSAAQETAPQIPLRGCFKKSGGDGQRVWDFGEGGMHAITHVFLQKVSASCEETVITMKEFSACLDMRLPRGR